MKTISTAIKVMSVAATFVGLLVSTASATNTPDILIIVTGSTLTTPITTTTNKSGKAIIRKLAPGSYTVSMRLTSEIIQQLAQPATEGTPATPGSPAIPGTPAKNSEVIVKVTANGRTIEAKHLLVTSFTKPGSVDIRTKNGKKLTFKIKKGGPQKIAILIGLLLPAVQK